MENQLAKSSGPSKEEGLGEVRYVARQPILNLQGRVHGYELLFRNGPEAVSRGDGDMATGTMLDNAVIFGLEEFTTGLTAFINCTSETLTERLVRVLPPSTTVLGIPATLPVTPALVDACRELKREGFQFALDDFVWSESVEPLLSLADYIRLDFTNLGTLELDHLQRANGNSISIVAKKVETPEDYKKACAAGCTFFQGGYFCNPVLLRKNKIPANRLSHFDIVRLLHHDPIDVRQISRLVMRDAALTYRLLRLVNSPLYATHREVCSIESAIMIVGDQTLRRIASLAILSEINADQPPDILHMALVRARFCELAARFCWLSPPEQYLLGMFSMVPAMLRVPMADVTSSLPLRDQVCRALRGERNPERALLTWLELHERADWEACDAICNSIGLTHDKLMLCYVDAVVWAQVTLSSVI
jgi:EAL and modified HD-GYP domain-containing signal transduction protein